MMAGRATKLALAALVLLHAAVVGAGFFAAYDPGQQNRDMPFAPPARIHFVENGKFHLRPFVYQSVPVARAFARYTEDTSHPHPVRFFVRDAKGGWHLFGVDEPARIFLLGSDGYGRDQFSRLLFGGRISLLAGLLAAVLSLALGALAGSLAGFYGGWLDDALMRLSEVSMALPWIYLLVAVRASLPLRLSATAAFAAVAAVIGLAGWPQPARLVRGIVLSGRERSYVLAARGFGATDWYILRRHVLPLTGGVLLTQAALLTPHYILAEVTFSFLGLGVGEPAASLGTMLGTLQYHTLVSYWWMALPAVALVPLFLSYHVIADSLQQHFQPVS